MASFVEVESEKRCVAAAITTTSVCMSKKPRSGTTGSSKAASAEEKPEVCLHMGKFADKVEHPLSVI